MRQGMLNQVVKGITDGLRGTPAGSRAVQEKDFETREDFEAEARRRPHSVIIYSTEPLGFGVNLPEIDELPGADE